MLSKTVWLLITIIISYRLAFFGVSVLADYLLPYAPTFAYALDKLPNYGLDRWLYSWANFDGVHYLTIVENGYFGTGLIQAFFPLYPITIWLVNELIDNTILSSLVVSNVATVVAAVWLFFLFKEKYNRSTAWFGFFSLLTFPTAFFLFAAYGESLFMVFMIGTFWFLEKKQWLLMSLCIVGAAATRLVGIFLVPAIIMELLMGQQFMISAISQIGTNFKKQLTPLLFTLLGSVGLLVYMGYLWYRFDDPLFFWHVQEEFGGGREEKIILLPQTIWRYLKIFMTVQFDLRWFTYVQEFFFGVLPVSIMIYFWLKKQIFPQSWTVFSMLALLLPTVTGTFSSMPRYALVAFPLYLSLGIAYNQYPKLRWGLALSAILLVCNTVLFIQGYWIA